MRRRWSVVLAALAVAGGSLGLSLLRHAQKAGTGATPVQGQAFIDDSLGVAIRLPASSQWTLHREAGAPDGRVVSLKHEGGKATVVLYVLPASPEDNIETVLHRRRERVAGLFGVRDLSQVISHVVADTVSEVNRKSFRHWQALTQVIEVPGEGPSRAMFMWLLTKDSRRSVEAIGTVRVPAEPKPEEGAVTEHLLEDVGYILQSLIVR